MHGLFTHEQVGPPSHGFYIDLGQILLLGVGGGGWVQNVRRRDAPNASGKLTSFSGEGQGSRVLPQSSWHIHRHCRKSTSCSRHFKSKQPSSSNKLLITIFRLGMSLLQESFLMTKTAVQYGLQKAWWCCKYLGGLRMGCEARLFYSTIALYCVHITTHSPIWLQLSDQGVTPPHTQKHRPTPFGDHLSCGTPFH